MRERIYLSNVFYCRLYKSLNSQQPLDWVTTQVLERKITRKDMKKTESFFIYFSIVSSWVTFSLSYNRIKTYSQEQKRNLIMIVTHYLIIFFSQMNTDSESFHHVAAVILKKTHENRRNLTMACTLYFVILIDTTSTPFTDERLRKKCQWKKKTCKQRNIKEQLLNVNVISWSLHFVVMFCSKNNAYTTISMVCDREIVYKENYGEKEI